MPCAGPCSAFECQLGAACEETSDPNTGALIDPCGQAGLVCDISTSVCRAPQEFEVCTPGGPSCQPIAESTADDLQCVQVSLFTGNPYVCAQPCALTADCVDPLTTCQKDGTTPGEFCFYSICSTYFGTCPSSGANDGLCVPYLNGTSTLGLCEQAALSGGNTGSACLSGGNRQVGGLCDTQDFCVLGLCSAVCNAGTAAGGPSCAGLAGGPSCVPILNESGDADDLGICSVACNFLSDAGGGCAPTDGGAPEKCFPQVLFGLADVPTGVCVLGPTTGLAAGQPCNAEAAIDDCADGSRCVLGLFDGTAGAFCAQLCDLPGLSPGGCNSGQTCVSGFASSSTGYCATQLADGGQIL